MIGISSVIRSPVQRTAGIALTGILLAALAACGDDGGEQTSGEEQSSGEEQASGEVSEVQVLLPFSRSIAFWPVHVADELGYFEEEGIAINDEATDGSSFVVQQVSAGNAPYGIAVAEPAMLGYAQSPSFVTVYDFLTTNTFDVWVREDSDIQTMDDFESGDVIAIKDQAGGDIPRLNVLLEQAGLTPGADVAYQQFGDNTAIAADLLISEEADGLEISWNSLVGVKMALDEAGVSLRCLTCAEQEQYAAESLLVTTDYLEQNPELVEGFGRALAKATLFGSTNPDAAIEIMKEINPEEQTDEAYTQQYFSDAVAVMQPRPQEEKYGWQDPEAYARTMELLQNPDIAEGLSEPIDLETFVDNSLVDAYNDFDQDAVVQEAENWTQ